jgi:hypothetical protein
MQSFACLGKHFTHATVQHDGNRVSTAELRVAMYSDDTAVDTAAVALVLKGLSELSCYNDFFS